MLENLNKSLDKNIKNNRKNRDSIKRYKDTPIDKTKREFLNEWIRAVNQYSGFGTWKWAVSKRPDDINGIIEEAILR